MSQPSARPPADPFDDALLAVARTPVDDTHPLLDLFKAATALASAAVDVDRVGVWLYTDDRSALRCVCLYERPLREHTAGVTLHVADFPDYFAAMEADRALPAAAAAADPRTHCLEDAYLKPLGITSLLDAAVRRDGKTVGVLCHEHIGPPRQWTTDERRFAAALADQLGVKMAAAELAAARADLFARGAALDPSTAVARVAAGAAHDFKNLLTVVSGSAALLANRPDLPTAAAGLVSDILSAADRGIELVRQMADLGRPDPDAPQVVAPADLLEKVWPLLQTAAGNAHPVSVYRQTGAARVFADPARLERAVLELVVNARDANPSGGPIGLTVGGGPAGFTCVSVSDAGPGMDPATAARAFDPFFTTKPTGKGSGLGLSLVRQTAERAGGRVELDTAPGRGTTVRLLLPRVSGE